MPRRLKPGLGRNAADHAGSVWGEGRTISTANNDLAGRSKRAGHVFR
jgi:hypothetical protein